ncbi:MAG: CotH kinase family protein [Clostridia bacterium]|nr:CotH kinase family protein [Clostridia bacterium]
MLKKLILLLLLLTAAGYALAEDGDIVINEVMASNGMFEDEQSYDWIELHNRGSKTIDLSGWMLSDGKKNLAKFVFPEGTKLKAGGYITVWCTGEDGIEPGKKSPYYASFSLKSEGETLYLTNAQGARVQTLAYPQQYGNISWGLPAGFAGAPAEADYGYLVNASRGKKNDAAVFPARTEDPALATVGGFYPDGVTVQAGCPAGAVLRYTTDGDTPDEKSPVFPAEGLVISRTTAVRVRAFREGEVPSSAVSATYIVEAEQLTPVVCLVTDDKYLFNKKTGALVRGTGDIPNYDKEWEYPVNIEYYNAQGVCEINQMGTFTASGHSARQNAQKSIALYARKAYGKESFAFSPFPHRDYTEYQALLLRGANSDFSATRLRDITASSLAEGQGILYQDYVIIQVYINGEYWGHYNLREKINKHFIAAWEGITDEAEIDQIDILARTGTDRFTQHGDNEDWLALADFCKTHDLNVPENLAYVEERLDIDNLFTHAAYQIILGNVDFTNVRVYRVPGGKWKYILFDVEACWRGLDKTPLEYYIKPVSGKIQGFRHEPLNALLAVPEYRDKFLRRVAELLGTVFVWDNVDAHFQAVTDQLEPILPRHIERWNNMKLKNWRTNVNATKYYARVRPRKIPELLQKAMKLTDEEVEYYFGDVLRKLEVTNAKPE